MNMPIIFISYSSKDLKAVERIHQRLEEYGLTVWRDKTRLETDWSREIACALADSDVICLVWTANSAASKWVKNEWLTARALEKKIVVCWLNHIPPLPKPLENLDCIQIKSAGNNCDKLIRRLRNTSGLPTKYDYTILPSNSYIPFNPNPNFTGRGRDLLELYLKMIGNLNKIGINQAGTVGMGGIGKTQLAVEFVYRFSFGFESIFWIQAADPCLWRKEFVSLARDRLQLKIPDRAQQEDAERQYLFVLQKYLKEHPNTLIIMDNIGEPGLLNNDTYLWGHTPLSLGCDLLFTTRQHFNIPGVLSQEVDVLPVEGAFHLLTSGRQPADANEIINAQSICNAVGYLPLALVLANARLKKFKKTFSYADYYSELQKNKLGIIDYKKITPEELATRHIASVEVTLKSQWEMMTDKNARLLFTLAGQLPEAEILPKARLGLLSGLNSGEGKLEQPADEAFSELSNFCFVEDIGDNAKSIRLHPLVRDFASCLVLESDRAAFRAHAAKKLKTAAFDFSVLYKQLQERNVESIIDDLQTGVDWFKPEDSGLNELVVLRDTIHLSAHVLSIDKTQLASQLLGRLLECKDNAIAAILKQPFAMEKPWIRPMTASLLQPGGMLVRILSGHTGGVNGVTVTGDGCIAVSASQDKTLKVWDIKKGVELHTLSRHASFIYGVGVSGDGSIAVSASHDHTCKVWDIKKGIELHTLKGHTSSVRGVSVSGDGSIAVSASSDNTLKVWDIKKGIELHTLKGHTSSVMGVSITGDGSIAVSASSDNTLKVWDNKKGIELHTLKGHTSSVMGISVTGDGSIAVSASEDNTLMVWDIKKGIELHTLSGHTSPVWGVSVSGDGSIAVSASRDNTLKVWDIKKGIELHTLSGHANWVYGVSVTWDGSIAVSASRDKTLKVWDIKKGVKRHSLKGHTSSVRGVSVTGDGSIAVSASEDHTLKVWDMKKGIELHTLRGHTDRVNGVNITGDGSIAVSASEDKTLKVWDIKKGIEVHTLRGHTSPVWGVSITGDRRIVVSASWDKTLKVWDIKKGIELNTLSGHTNFVRGVSVTRDGSIAVSASEDNTLKVWDIKKGIEVHTLNGHKNHITGVCVTEDGRIAVSASWDKTLKVWDIKKGIELNTLSGHNDFVIGVSVTGDGRIAVSASLDNTLKVWDIKKGIEIASFYADANIYCCEILGDHKHIIAGDASGYLHFLELMGYETTKSEGEF